jgi:soluble lytic murein transglycosylase
MIWWILGSALAAVPVDVAGELAAGDCAAVVAALPKPAADDERLAVGRCLRKLDRDADAAAMLGGIADGGPLSGWARYERALALADAGRPADAITAVEGLVLPGDYAIELRLLRDRSLVASKRSADARDDLRALLDGPVADEARWWLAAGAIDRGEADAAVPVLQTLWSTSVRGGWSEQAATALAKLDHPAPDVSTSDGRTLVRARISALRAANRHADALALLKTLRAVEPATTTAQKLELARVAFDAHAYAESRDAYAAVLGAPADASGAPGDLFEYALTTARAGDYDTAGVIYRKVDAIYPNTKDGDFASFKLGYMEYDRSNLAKAREELAAHRTRHPDSAHGDEALWFSGRAAWRLGQTDAALTDFAALIATYPNSSLAPGAAYWTARAKGVAGDAAGEKAALERVIASYPTSGHAYYAAYRLGRTFPHHDRVARPAWPASFASKPQVQRAETLLAVGFVREARAELDGIGPSASAAGRDAALAAAYALIAAGDYQGGQALAKPYCTSPWKDGDPVAQQACTPMPEAAIIGAVAKKYSLDPLIPYGIMTAESALDPTVTSIAGARGLMQLMPAELPRIHADLYGDGPVDPDDLYVGPYNAAMGTTELGMKSKSLHGVLDGTDAPAIVASYNGGEEAVRRWVAGYDGKPPFDEFAEDVGYTETRQYVRRVLGYVMAYRWVYGDE